MPDNLGVTPGVGATVAADDIGGALHQRVKVSIGADGTASDWTGDVTSPILSVASAISGQITVTTAGTAVQGSNVALTNGVFLKAHPDNTDAVWVGNDGAGDVAAANGFPLDPGELIVVSVANLQDLWFDADVNGEKICWLSG